MSLRGGGGRGAKQQLRRSWRLRSCREAASCNYGSVVSVRNALFAGALLLAALNVFRLGGTRETRWQRVRSVNLMNSISGIQQSSQHSINDSETAGPLLQGNSSLKKLIIGIPTVPRGQNYLKG